MAADIKRVRWTRDVYEPSDDSFLLVDALHARLRELHRRRQRADAAGAAKSAAAPAPAPRPPGWPRVALEIGCGSGYVITSLALLLREAEGAAAAGGGQGSRQQSSPPPPPPPRLLLATDFSAPALASTAETLAAHGLRPGADVELVQGDMLDALRRRLRGVVDLLVFNPPYVPTPDDEMVAPVLGGSAGNGDGDGGGAGGGGLGIVAAAWAGGDRGRRVVDRLLPQLGELLSDEGEAFVVAVEENDPADMIRAAVDTDEDGARAAAGTAAAAAAAALAAAGAGGRQEGGGLPRRAAGGAKPPCWARSTRPLRGEVFVRRPADEEALCVLRFFRGGREGDGGAGESTAGWGAA